MESNYPYDYKTAHEYGNCTEQQKRKYPIRNFRFAL